MYLDEILSAQKQARAWGVASVCSVHPYVLKQTLKSFERPLIEATCNQVNQFGGYTGMTPVDFVSYLREVAEAADTPFENIILGGDHLGPSVWQHEPAETAMEKAEALVDGYVRTGFVKIHLDCSMRLADDPGGALDLEVSAKRAARLALAAERAGSGDLRYVIGSEVPLPGGIIEAGESVRVTAVEDVRQTIEVTRAAFYNAGLQSAWERVIAVVVQPGVEYGDDFVLPYRSKAAQELSRFIETQPFVYEAHSTDYQTPQALGELVRDHFAILKVGPALTFAFREAVFALAMIENELLPAGERSNLISIMDKIMVEKPGHWIKYYHGSEREKAIKRRYSLSDRIRYYWTDPLARGAFEKLMTGLAKHPLPATLLRQFVPDVYARGTQTGVMTPEDILLAKIQQVLDNYAQACNPQ